MSIATKEERDIWYDEAQKVRDLLSGDYSDIYDMLPHEIEHYLADADIRAKDAGYARYQEEILADLLVISKKAEGGKNESEVNGA